ncbi:MAG TPA: hypothetical protein PKV17_16525 [Aquabacterium sp.]|nr:hypothetical protein [Aquabacterium sp.]HRH30388.1 hypothetical protein [Aquabacterium sp.]
MFTATHQEQIRTLVDMPASDPRWYSQQAGHDGHGLDAGEAV